MKMTSKKRVSLKLPASDVTRAQRQIHRAVCKIVMIAGGHRDDSYAMEAAEALCNLGSQAALPLAYVIEKIPSAERRRRMVIQLREIPPSFVPDVWAIVLRIARTDPSEEVRAAAAETSSILRLRYHERSARLAELSVLWHKPAARGDEAATG